MAEIYKIGSDNLIDRVSTFGGTNLFKWTGLDGYNKELQLNNYQNTGSFTQFTNSLQFDPSKTLGEKYTISFDIISPNGTTNVSLYNNNGYPKYFWFAPVTLGSIGNTWTHFSYTVTNTEYTGTGTISTNEQLWRRIEIYCPSQMGCKVRNVKVEKGNKPTDWTPALQDLVKYDSSTSSLVFFQ